MAGQKARDLLIVGLRNAHAMETQARELMERQSERTGDFPKVQATAGPAHIEPLLQSHGRARPGHPRLRSAQVRRGCPRQARA